MNTELGLRSIVRQKAQKYQGGTQHKKFENLLEQDFTAPQINQKWATDFTYLFLHGGDVRYNCTIIDLHGRSVVASLTARRMTSDLAIRTLGKALSSQRKRIKGLILHSDQGSPYTSRAFTEFCEAHEESLYRAWNILLIPHTTMYDRILITDIVRHSKRDIRIS